MDTSGEDSLNEQPWFNFLWRAMAGLLVMITGLLVFRMCKYYQNRQFLREQVIAGTGDRGPGPNPASVLTNRQATALFGNQPGVIISGMDTPQEYRPADGKGDFGVVGASQHVPELQEASQFQLNSISKAALVGPSATIIARKASTSGVWEDIPEGIPYQRNSSRILNTNGASENAPQSEEEDEELASKV